jgi:acetyltransferase-like isoleucine patch superfamily enzyme
MLFEIIACFLGFIKLLIYKFVYCRRLTFHFFIKFDKSSRIVVKKKSKIILGKNVKLRHNCLLRTEKNSKLIISDGVFLNDNCIIDSASSIYIGKDTLIGPNVIIFDHDHDYKKELKNLVAKPISIGSNCWIGANCIILKGVIIGNNCVIAAGTSILNDIPDNSIVYDKINLQQKQKDHI